MKAISEGHLHVHVVTGNNCFLCCMLQQKDVDVSLWSLGTYDGGDTVAVTPVSMQVKC